MKPPNASAASDVDQRRNAAPRRRGLEAAAIVAADPSVIPSLSDTFAPKFETRSRARSSLPEVLEQFAWYCNHKTIGR
jgi:hypothetical protein